MLRSCARALSALRALHAARPRSSAHASRQRRAGRRALSAGHRRVQVRYRHRVSAAPLSRASTARSCSCDCLSHGFPLRHVRRRETAELSDMQLGERSPQGTAACRCAALVTRRTLLRSRARAPRALATLRSRASAACAHSAFGSDPVGRGGSARGQVQLCRRMLMYTRAHARSAPRSQVASARLDCALDPAPLRSIRLGSDAVGTGWSSPGQRCGPQALTETSMRSCAVQSPQVISTRCSI